jgi:glycosyltransferase involved in cell wall biosynthesis
MHLGFHYHIPAHVVDGKIYTIAFQGLFIDYLAKHFDKVTLYMYLPLEHEKKELDYALTSENVSLVSLMKHYKIPFRIALYPRIKKKIKKLAETVDLLLVRAPTPLLPLITKDISKKIPFAYLVVGEMSLHVDAIQQKEWRKSLIRQYVNWNEAKQEEYAKQALIFCNSAITYDKYKTISDNCYEIRTTTLRTADIYRVDDRCTGDEINVLFTGRIEKGKGILEITEAIGTLNQQGKNVKLNIVGWADPKDNIMNLIAETGAKFGISDKIIFHGFKKAGEELFSFYKSADIFIVASQENEGFPRTIWEALAHSLPVIAVPVGSIGHFLKHGHDALFIEKKNPQDIEAKIKMVLNDQELRKNLIKNGLETVKDVTLELQSEKMATIIKNFTKAK